MELRTNTGSVEIETVEQLRRLLHWLPSARGGDFAVLARAQTEYIQAFLDGALWIVELRAGGPETHVEVSKGQQTTAIDPRRIPTGSLTADEVLTLFIGYFEGNAPGARGAIH